MRNHHRIVLLLAAWVAAGCDNLMAQQLAREQLVRFTQGLQSFSASFEQRVLGTDGTIEDQSAGRVWLSEPDFIRWEYGGDFPQLVVADGQRIWIYDEVLEQVTVKPQSDFAADSPLSLLTDISKLDEQFQVREGGDMDGMLLLELRSNHAESEFDRVLLGLQQDELKLMTMEDAFGLRTEIRFAEQQRNPVLDPDLFSFTPPQGVDVIGGSEADPSEP